MDQRVAALVGTGRVMVGLGCGSGSVLDEPSSDFEILVGLAISLGRYRRHGEPRKGWTFLVADLNVGIPLEDAFAEVVHANQVIEHLVNPLSLLSEVQGALRPGGRRVGTTPTIRYFLHLWKLAVTGEGPRTSSYRGREGDEWDGGHIHYFTANDLEWMTRSSGFQKNRTSALIDLNGSLMPLRRMLDRHSNFSLVTGVLTGNILLVA